MQKTLTSRSPCTGQGHIFPPADLGQAASSWAAGIANCCKGWEVHQGSQTPRLWTGTVPTKTHSLAIAGAPPIRPKDSTAAAPAVASFWPSGLERCGTRDNKRPCIHAF